MAHLQLSTKIRSADIMLVPPTDMNEVTRMCLLPSNHINAKAVHVQFFCLLQIPHDVREARRDELVSLQQDVGQHFAESLIGCQVS
jgi:hypothetical protein